MAQDASPQMATVDYTRTCFKKYLDKLYEQRSREWRFTGRTAAELSAWQTATRKKLMEVLGVDAAPQKPLILKREVEAETPNYVRETLFYETFPSIVVPATLLTPKSSSPRPAVLCPPGHGKGKSQVLDEKSEYKGYPLRLAEQGFVALVPEHIGFGQRCGEPGKDRSASHIFYWTSLNLLGQSAIGVFLWELQRGLDILESLPTVAKGRIGCWGLSLGGEMTLFLAAADERVKAACISCFLSSYKSSFLDVTHCGCGYVPGLARYMEHADIAVLIAPRPLLVESSTKDIFPLPAARQAVEELKRIYAIAGAPQHIDQDIFVGGHEVSGAKAFDWFRRWL